VRLGTIVSGMNALLPEVAILKQNWG